MRGPSRRSSLSAAALVLILGLPLSAAAQAEELARLGLPGDVLGLAYARKPRAKRSEARHPDNAGRPGFRVARKVSGERPAREPEESTPKDAKPAKEERPPEGAHSSLIVDGRGLGLVRSMGPRFYDAEGTIVYGNFSSDWDHAQKGGVAAYASDLNEAKNLEMAGKSPLVVRLASLRPGVPSDGVILEEDVERIRQERKRWDFLRRQRVVIVTEE